MDIYTETFSEESVITYIYITVASCAWGKGVTMGQSLQECKSNYTGNKRSMKYATYKCGVTAWVNGMGSIVRHSTDIVPVMVDTNIKEEKQNIVTV